MSKAKFGLEEARLARFVKPRHYDIHYSSIDLYNNNFVGSVSILVEVIKSPALFQFTNSNDDHSDDPNVDYGDDDGETYIGILIHALELHLDKARIEEQCIENMEASKCLFMEASNFEYSEQDQVCRIDFPLRDKDFNNDDEDNEPFFMMHKIYKLTIDFHGQLNSNMQGLYRSTYTDPTGTNHLIATTQFEPTDARRAFPCFDEPNLKATFCLTVTLPKQMPYLSMKCISNTPITSEQTQTLSKSHTLNDSDKQQIMERVICFQKTPLMSTYLLALVIGDFDVISSTSELSRITTSVYTVPGKVKQGRFCLGVASQCLDLYKDLFDVPYPLVKSDLLAIPDFAAGAMENWGCVTYREAKILVKQGSTSESMKRGIARTVCHELAHQWFGNLVTMDFWTQLWLNEGFARFMEFVGIDTIFPQWDAWTEFVQSVYGLALSLDSMKSSHPVEVEVQHPDEINAIFDAISYAKGASVIRMLSSLIGFDTFMDGMKLYLKRHAYGNATTEMLWASVAEASNMPIADLMSPWTSQTGFPLLLLNDEDITNIPTTRFLASGPNSADMFDLHCAWPIPITVQVQGETDIYGPWILHNPSNTDISDLYTKLNEWTAAGKWFKFNVSQTGFYRVAYTQRQWERLAPAMSPDGPLSASDRLGLISDSFAIGRAGYASIVDSLKLIQDFGNHSSAEYAVWQELSENLANLATLYRFSPFFKNFQSMLKQLYSKQMDLLGWDARPGESQRTGTLRGTVINMLCIAGDESVVRDAFVRFELYRKDPVHHSIPGDLRGIIFKAALRKDEDYIYEKVKELYERSTFPEEQRSCLSVMGSVLNMDRHEETMEYILFSGKVRLQDIAFPLNALASNSNAGGRACWKLIETKFEKLSSKFSSGPIWAGLIGLCVRGLTTLEEADAVEEFFADPTHPCGSGKRRLGQALEAVRNKAMRLERDRYDVSFFLKQFE